MSNSLFERLGGEAAIMAAVDLFYAKVQADELTRPFFGQLDMVAQSRKQVAFMAWAFGGPEAYKGRDLRTSHRRLVKEMGMTDVHFDAVAQHLKATLEELGIAKELVDEALTTVASTRNEVLDR
jgi:hemoglobin